MQEGISKRIDIKLSEKDLQKCFVLLPYLRHILPVMFFEWLDRVREDEVRELAYKLSASKDKESLLRGYFKDFFQGHNAKEEESVEGKEKKEDFKTRYGDILSL